jgi:hypothetical protein
MEADNAMKYDAKQVLQIKTAFKNAMKKTETDIFLSQDRDIPSKIWFLIWNLPVEGLENGWYLGYYQVHKGLENAGLFLMMNENGFIETGTTVLCISNGHMHPGAYAPSNGILSFILGIRCVFVMPKKFKGGIGILDKSTSYREKCANESLNVLHTKYPSLMKQIYEDYIRYSAAFKYTGLPIDTKEKVEKLCEELKMRCDGLVV